MVVPLQSSDKLGRSAAAAPVETRHRVGVVACAVWLNGAVSCVTIVADGCGDAPRRRLWQPPLQLGALAKLNRTDPVGSTAAALQCVGPVLVGVLPCGFRAGLIRSESHLEGSHGVRALQLAWRVGPGSARLRANR